MYRITQNFDQPMPAAFVVNDSLPDEVAMAVIKGGRQMQPFYIFDMDEAYHQIEKFRNQMPRVKIFYAMKANDSEMMLRLAVALGLGFDCASPGEISKIRSLNVPPTSIIYGVPVKTQEEMIYAQQAGVQYTTFDTSCELKRLKQYWPDAKLLIRIRVDSDSVYKLADKFGCNFNTEAVDLLDEAAEIGLDVVGVAFHVGSVCLSEDSYAVGLRHAKALFDYEAKAGRQMNILDIGGGFFRDNTDRFDKVCEVINSSVEELFPDRSVQVIAEPGRYVCESAFTLYCNINNVKKTIKNDKPLNVLYINDGVNGTLRFFEQWHTVRKFTNSSDCERLDDTLLWGPTLDGRDRMALVQLPRCTAHDWLAFNMQGAYTLSLGGRFSGTEIALIRPIISSRLWFLIKYCPVFSASDFVANPDIAEPLPSTLPPLLKTVDDRQYSHLPSLIED